MMTTNTKANELVNGAFGTELDNGVDGIDKRSVESVLSGFSIDAGNIAIWLAERHVDIDRLATRVDDGLEVTPLVLLVADGFEVDALNEALHSNCTVSQLNTGFTHLAA